MERLHQTYEASGTGDKMAVEAMGKWSKDDGALFAALMREHAAIKAENGIDDDDDSEGAA